MYDNLPGLIRALRRRADLSQRELAERAGLPATTVANIESGRAADPKFRTVERLVAAAGGGIAITMADGSSVSAAADDNLRDYGNRRYPAHLDVRPVRTIDDWWGFAAKKPKRRDDPYPPEYTFDRNRRVRDLRRRTAAAQPVDALLYVRRLGPGDEAVLDALRREAAVRYLADPNVQHWVAESPGGRRLAHLVAYRQSLARAEADRLVIHELWFEAPGVDEAAGLCLVGAAARETMSTDRPAVLSAVTDDPHTEAFYRQLGFRCAAPQPVWLELPDQPPDPGVARPSRHRIQATTNASSRHAS